jgi:hypothetical protein
MMIGAIVVNQVVVSDVDDDHKHGELSTRVDKSRNELSTRVDESRSKLILRFIELSNAIAPKAPTWRASCRCLMTDKSS